VVLHKCSNNKNELLPTAASPERSATSVGLQVSKSKIVISIDTEFRAELIV
jgi:hypothetical protein